jgi:hypothetical protein
MVSGKIPKDVSGGLKQSQIMFVTGSSQIELFSQRDWSENLD